MSRINPRYEVVSPSSQEELQALLEEMWPDKRIPAHEFHELMDMNTPDRSILKSHLGLNRSWYNTHELAEWLWQRSNFHDDEQ
ncbi:hypothetical protein D3C85_729330 [compost metagenome]